MQERNTIHGETDENKRTVRRVIKLKIDNPDISQESIAKIVGRNPSSVSRALRRYNINIKKLKSYKDYRADILAGVQANILESIDNETIKKASLKDRNISFGILYDKERLERGLSTQNTALSNVVEIVDRRVRQKNQETQKENDDK